MSATTGSQLEQEPRTDQNTSSPALVGWTTPQLGHALALTIAPALRPRTDKNGYRHPDYRRLAGILGVQPATVQRWLRAPTLGDLPAGRTAQLAQLIGISADTRTRETAALRQHQEYQRRKGLGRRRGNLTEYAHLGWLDPHLLALIAYPHLKLHRLAVIHAPQITQDTPLGDGAGWTSPLLTRAARDGEVACTRLFEDRFDALTHRDKLMTHIDPWRLEVLPALVPFGPTTVWLEHPIDI